MSDEPARAGDRERPSFLRKLGLAFLLTGIAAGAIAMLVLAAAAIVFS